MQNLFLVEAQCWTAVQSLLKQSEPDRKEHRIVYAPSLESAQDLVIQVYRKNYSFGTVTAKAVVSMYNERLLGVLKAPEWNDDMEYYISMYRYYKLSDGSFDDSMIRYFYGFGYNSADLEQQVVTQSPAYDPDQYGFRYIKHWTFTQQTIMEGLYPPIQYS